MHTFFDSWRDVIMWFFYFYVLCPILFIFQPFKFTYFYVSKGTSQWLSKWITVSEHHMIDSKNFGRNIQKIWHTKSEGIIMTINYYNLLLHQKLFYQNRGGQLQIYFDTQSNHNYYTKIYNWTTELIIDYFDFSK